MHRCRNFLALCMFTVLLPVFVLVPPVVVLAQQSALDCATEPWGRYSMSGGVYDVNGRLYMYSTGGDTSSATDDEDGGVVRTNWRFGVDDGRSGCWEQLTTGPVARYRSTGTLLNGSLYVFAGTSGQNVVENDFYKLHLATDDWSEVVVVGNGSTPSPRYKAAAVALSNTTMLVTGGREGTNVLADAWVFDSEQIQWTRVADITPLYRHGIAFDSKRNVTWILGGLDDNFQRQSTLYKFDLTTLTAITSPTGDVPGTRASHAVEYVPELDAVLVWGGTSTDSAAVYLYNITANSWCSLLPANRPSYRDAFLWTVKFPHLYVYGGDVAWVNLGNIYSIADVHRLDLMQPTSWELLYDPFNIRARDNTEECDGTNDVICRPPTRQSDLSAGESTCTHFQMEDGGGSTTTTTTTTTPSESESESESEFQFSIPNPKSQTPNPRPKRSS